MQLNDFDLGDIQDWVSLVFIKVFREGEHIGYVFVHDPSTHGSRSKDKLPGGRKVEGHGSPEITAISTVQREANISLIPDNLQYLGKQVSGGGKSGNPRYWSCLFVASINLGQTDNIGTGHDKNKGEVPEFFDAEAGLRLIQGKSFLSYHRNLLRHFGLV